MSFLFAILGAVIFLWFFLVPFFIPEHQDYDVVLNGTGMVAGLAIVVVALSFPVKASAERFIDECEKKSATVIEVKNTSICVGVVDGEVVRLD